MPEKPRVERLTPLDLLMPRTYIQALLTFRTRSSTSAVSQSLQYGLDKLLTQIPWLSGRVVPTTSTTGTQEKATPALEIHWGFKEEPTTFALIDKGSISASYDTLSASGMPPADIPADVWPMPDTSDAALFAQGAPVFAASLFNFADGRGIGLCICAHHSAVDVTGFAQIVRLWARNTAGSGSGSPFSWKNRDRLDRLSQAISPDLGVTELLSTENIFASHPEYSNMPPTLPETGLPQCTSSVFSISLARVYALRDQILKPHDEAKPATSQSLSTNTLVCALLWSAVTRARARRNQSLLDNLSRLVMAVDGRRRITEPSFSRPGDPYLGNTVLYSLAKLPVKQLTGASFNLAPGLLHREDKSPGIICDAIAVSQSPSRISTRYIAEVFSLVNRVEDYRSVFPGWDLFGSRDLTITSWADLDFYDMDFGAGIGKAEYMRLPYMEADGVCLILPRKRDRAMDGTERADQVVEVMVLLRRDDMEALDWDDTWKSFLY